jgi:uncharacterized protein YjiS (DUF1127 family)
MHEHTIAARGAQAPTDRRALAQGVVRIVDRLLLAMEIRRQRRALAALDDRALKDIGITRAEAGTESSRGFWDLPRPF